MELAAGRTLETIREHMREFVAGLTGCVFAQSLAAPKGKALNWLAPLARPDAEFVDTLAFVLDAAGRTSQGVMVVFPTLRGTDDVVEVLRALGSADRWQLTAPKWKPDHARDDELVGLTWSTEERRRSTTMGFAPFGSMPVHRRAPYVALAIWPGGHSNPHWPARHDEFVSFTDMPVTTRSGPRSRSKGTRRCGRGPRYRSPPSVKSRRRVQRDMT